MTSDAVGLTGALADGNLLIPGEGGPRAPGVVLYVRQIAPGLGVMGGHQPISRLFTVRLEDGTTVEPPLLVSDLGPAARG